MWMSEYWEITIKMLSLSAWSHFSTVRSHGVQRNLYLPQNEYTTCPHASSMTKCVLFFCCSFLWRNNHAFSSHYWFLCGNKQEYLKARYDFYFSIGYNLNRWYGKYENIWKWKWWFENISEWNNSQWFFMTFS